MTAEHGAAAAITAALVLFSAGSCAAHREPMRPAAVTDADPLAGGDWRKVHYHGHDMLAVQGQLLCLGPCDVGETRVLSQRYLGKSGYEQTTITVESDGQFHGELAVSYGGTGDRTSYFPQALVFTLAGCQDAVVDVSSPWRTRVVELRCE